MKLILATTSPYRIDVFTKARIPFVSETSDVDEYAAERPSDPMVLTGYLAKLKAEAVAQRHTEGMVVGFDSVCFFEGKVFEKPKTKEEAFVRLQLMAGKMIEYHTGIHIINTATHQTLSDTTKTEIYLRSYTKEEIDFYMDNCNEEYRKHAHSLNPEQYYSMSFITKIVGEPYGMIGTPLGRVMEMLQDLGYNIQE